ncbi:phosphate starvation-inducible protein PhoH [Candidatus Geothermarchaeota archaeon ex4572_27]|nr:MAG: phosphate starvation-inducible protein PhoH [Candidatus Geothermarchaeota archaeon ex4572_27]
MKYIKPLSEGQARVAEALASDDYEVVAIFGPTGTGKSLLTVLYGLEALEGGKYRRFIISRPVVDVVTGRELSSADLGAKYMELASSYLEDLISGFVEWGKVRGLMEEGRITFADPHYMRGRTFDDSLIFIDDAQSMPPESAIEVMTRLGRNSKLVVAGDPVFQRGMERNGATVLREVLLGEERAKVVDLGLKDIARPGARRGVRLLIEMRMRDRQLNSNEQAIAEAVRSRAPDADLITVLDLTGDKKAFNITSEHTPDALLVAKEGHLGRVIGRGGERINEVEREVGLKLRGVEFTLDLREVVRAIHPVSWISKHIVDADFAGPQVLVKVDEDNFGAFLGQKGAYVRFLDSAFRRLMGVGVKAEPYEEEKPRRARRR